MADFVSELGGTAWAGVQTQYYQVVNGVKTYMTNPKEQMAGIWADDTDATEVPLRAVRVRARHHVVL